MGALRESMKADLRLRNLRPSTQQMYLGCVRRFATYFMRSPSDMGAEQVREYLLHLRDVEKVKPATLRVHVSALMFLYRWTLRRPEVVRAVPMPKLSRKLPEILSGTEVEELLATIVSIKYRAILMTTYGAGLRLVEACSLQVNDVDSKRMLLRVREGKGGHERYAMLSRRLLDVLREYYKYARPIGPYLFPGRRPDTPLAKDSVRKALGRAVKKCGFTKRVTPHVLRHSFASHLLDSGADIRTIQVLLGHRSIRTTQLYAQVSKRQIARTRSPLDLLGTKDAAQLG